MNRIITLISCTILCVSCDYLNVVPDNEITLDDIFRSRTTAYDGLAKMYHFLPPDNIIHRSSYLLGDEYIGQLNMNDATGSLHGSRIMRGLQTTSAPHLGLWGGSGGSNGAYRGIRYCNIFLYYLDGVPGLSDEEREDWRAQAKFLKAWYHFLLLRQYGPIIIAGEAVSMDAIDDDLFQRRSKVEDCFDYIIGLLNEAIPNLFEQREQADWGMIERAGAYAIKARVLLYRASPFFSGNVGYFSDFLDHDNQPFFSMDNSEQTRKEKWREAYVAADSAILYAEKRGKQLYHYEGEPFLMDSADWRFNRENLKIFYDLRMLITKSYNNEMLWVNSNVTLYSDDEIQHACNMRVPYYNYDGNGVAENSAFSKQWLCASYNMASRYYTSEGLPIEESPVFDVDAMFNIVRTPADDDLSYDNLRGIMQPGKETVYFNMGREPRFYANLAVTAGYWRTQMARIRIMMYCNDEGGRKDSYSAAPYDYFCTGIGIKKFVHPESKSANWQRAIKFPYPIIRLADLYLMKAEALNEYLDAPNQEVWDAINLVRERAGIPDVETSWARATGHPDWHRDKEGMRNIILRERANELAFEGQYYWDMVRHLRAINEFSKPIYGWDAQNGTNAEAFFVLQPKQTRRFTERDYLWPISLNEMNTNGNLIQNPGW